MWGSYNASIIRYNHTAYRLLFVSSAIRLQTSTVSFELIHNRVTTMRNWTYGYGERWTLNVAPPPCDECERTSNQWAIGGVTARHLKALPIARSAGRSFTTGIAYSRGSLPAVYFNCSATALKPVSNDTTRRDPMLADWNVQNKPDCRRLADSLMSIDTITINQNRVASGRVTGHRP